MGTIIPRKRKSGTTGYHAQLLIKRKGKIVHRESWTFDRKQAAAAWLEKRETELAKQETSMPTGNGSLSSLAQIVKSPTRSVCQNKLHSLALRRQRSEVRMFVPKTGVSPYVRLPAGREPRDIAAASVTKGDTVVTLRHPPRDAAAFFSGG
jgi:hypothetical protein